MLLKLLKRHFKNAQGFTLAEVLITLGIIGVVAALTLPTLIQNHKKQTYVNQLKKVVNTLENAAQMAVAKEGASSFKDTKVYSRFMDYYTCSDNCIDITEDILNSLNIKYISIDKSNKDYSSDYKDLDDSRLPEYYYLKHPVVLPDGSILYFSDGTITVDVNGNKGPNQMGRDTFSLAYDYYNNGVLTDGAYKSACLEVTENYVALGCFYKKIVSDGWKMNY